jgi:NADPH:quinone reductase-like Zn-dependent oxidoreductase
MRAIMMRSYGGPEVLKLEEVARPAPLLTEVLVRVRAAGTNPVDAYVRAGAFPLLKPLAIPGWDVSGVVEAVAPGVNRFRVGDEVFGMPLFPRAAGAYAEYVAAPARQLARKSARLDHVHAGGLPLAGLTAWQAMVDIADVQAGQRVRTRPAHTSFSAAAAWQGRSS